MCTGSLSQLGTQLTTKKAGRKCTSPSGITASLWGEQPGDKPQIHLISFLQAQGRTHTCRTELYNIWCWENASGTEMGTQAVWCVAFCLLAVSKWLLRWKAPSRCLQNKTPNCPLRAACLTASVPCVYRSPGCSDQPNGEPCGQEGELS